MLLVRVINMYLNSNGTQQDDIKVLTFKDKYQSISPEISSIISQLVQLNTSLLTQIKDFSFSTNTSEELSKQLLSKPFDQLKKYFLKEQSNKFKEMNILFLEIYLELYECETSMLKEIQNQFIEVFVSNKIEELVGEIRKANGLVSTALEVNLEYIEQQKQNQLDLQAEQLTEQVEEVFDEKPMNEKEALTDLMNQKMNQSEKVLSHMKKKDETVTQNAQSPSHILTTNAQEEDDSNIPTLQRHALQDRRQKKQEDLKQSEDEDQDSETMKNKHLRGKQMEFEENKTYTSRGKMIEENEVEDEEAWELTDGELNSTETFSDTITEGTITKQLSLPSNSQYDYFQEKKLFVVQIVKDFKELFLQDQMTFIKKLTVNQVVKLARAEINLLKLNEIESIKDYVVKNSHNYNRIEEIKPLGEGGESQIFRMKVFQPVEIVAKTPLPPKGDETPSYQNIMMESHMIKLLADPEYIAEIVEEIIEYDSEKKEVINYIVIVEKAIHDLSNILLTWTDEKLSKANQEEFSQEKLAYFCLKAMEAMHYCHSNNVYYGDMKPPNLLVFRDMSIKLGDFGISIKLSSHLEIPIQENQDQNQIQIPLVERERRRFLDQTASIKGLTKGYSMMSIVQQFEDDRSAEFSYEQLLLNDYYSLRKTFENIFEQFKSKIKSDSIFFWMVKDLSELSVKSKQLEQVLHKWRSIISNDKTFITTLCDQIIKEEKIQAIPNILKLSKYRNIFYDIQLKFKEKETIMLQYTKNYQYQPLDEEESSLFISQEVIKPSMPKQIDPFEAIYTKDKLYKDGEKNLKFLNFIIADIEPYLSRLSSYVGPLLPSFYKDFYFEHFNSCFLFTSPFFKANIFLTRENFNSCPKNLLRKVFSQNQIEFIRFSNFIVSTTASQETSFERLLKALIKFAVEFNQQQLEFDLIYVYNKTIFLQNTELILKNKFDFAFRSKELCTQLKYPYDKAIQCYIYAIQCMKDLRGEINSYEIKFEMQKIQSIAKFNTYKKKSFYSLYYSLMAQSSDIQDRLHKRISLLEKERVLYSKIYGEQGGQMIQNGFELYQCNKQLKNTEKQKYYLSKIINYSSKQKKIEFLGFQIQDELTSNEDATSSLEQLKELNEILCAIILISFPNPNYSKIIIDPQATLQKLLIHETFSLQLPYFQNPKSIYFEGIQKIFKNSLQILSENLPDQFNEWANYHIRNILKGHQIKQINKAFNRQPYETLIVEKGIKDFKIPLTSVEVVLPDVCQYAGQILKGKFNGKGICIYADGRSYIGQFKNGFREGSGQQYWRNMTSFEAYLGQFKNDQFEGQGKLYYSNGDIYEGNFEKGNFEGKGKLNQGNALYLGSFSSGKKDGYGEQTYLEGVIYKGQWKNGKREGEGTHLINTDSKYERYEGEWKLDEKNGLGKQIYKNLDEYNGNWLQGKRNGVGTLTCKNGNQYQGEWKDDNFEGKGKEFSNQKLIFEGLFYRNERVMNANKQLQNGDHYIGFMTLDEQLFGQGELHLKNGDIYQGQFKQNHQHGNGVLKMKNGDTYEGQFVRNLKSGVGLCTLKSGIKSKVQFYKDEQVFYKEINKNNTRYEGTTCQEKKQGYGVYYDDVNKTKYIGYFVNDLMEGKGSMFFSNGDNYEGQFLKGLKHGLGKYSFKNGDVYSGSFERDLYNGEGTLSIQHKTGKFKKIYQGGFRNGVRNGFGILTSKDSVFKGYFVNGLKDGIGITQKSFKPDIKRHMIQHEGMYSNNKWNGPGKLIELESKKKLKRYQQQLYQDDYVERTYEGNFKDGKRQGIGKIFLNNQLLYHGEMMNDKMHGDGIKTSLRGYVYTGQFLFNKKNGVGEWVEQKFKYVGEFKNDSRSGNGTLFFNSGDIYEGKFVKDEISGQGVLNYSDGSIYAGDFKKGKKHGKGKYTCTSYVFEGVFKNNDFENGSMKFPNGDEYLGSFNGKNMNGQGVYRYSNGEVFEGEFVENKRMNKGQFKDLNNNVYVGGILENNMKHGFGVLKYQNGTIYEGNFVNNLKEGQGKFILSNGATEYEGKYKNEQKHGKGTQFFENETSTFEYTGEFYNNLMLGQGELKIKDKQSNSLKMLKVNIDFDSKTQTFQYQDLITKTSFPLDIVNNQVVYKKELIKDNDENTYFGDTLNGIKFGKGKLNFKNGDYYFGQFWKDQMHGAGNYMNANGSMYKGGFANNERNGMGLIIYENGDQYSGFFKQGFREGVGIYKKATLEEYNGLFKVDQLVGGGTYKDAKGTVMKGIFRPKEKVFIHTTRENKKISYQVDMYTDNLTLEDTIVDQSGNIYQGQVKNRQKHGNGVMKYSDGQVFEGLFENDKRVVGKITKINGEVLDGEFVDNQLKGQVKITYPDGGVYEGKYDTSMRVEYGKMLFANGDVYEGQFFNDQMQGDGMMKYANGEEYNGEFLFGQMHGKGLYTFNNGDRFKGVFLQGAFQKGDYEINEEQKLEEGKEGIQLSDLQQKVKLEAEMRQLKQQQREQRRKNREKDSLSSKKRKTTIKIIPPEIEENKILKGIEEQVVEDDDDEEVDRNFQSKAESLQASKLDIQDLEELKQDPENSQFQRRNDESSSEDEVEPQSEEEEDYEAPKIDSKDMPKILLFEKTLDKSTILLDLDKSDPNRQTLVVQNENASVKLKQQKDDFSYAFASNGKMIHTGILAQFKDDFQNEEELITQATKNQTLVFLDKEIEKFIETDITRLMQLVIKRYSKYYRQLELELKFHAEGGDCTIFKSMNHSLVVKVSKSSNQRAFINALEEIQMKRVLESNFVTEVKESVIVFNKTTKTISLTFEICEFAESQMKDFIQNETESVNQSTKLVFFMYQIIHACYSFHKKDISYNDFSDTNALVFKNYQVKFGDFGLAIKLSKEPDMFYEAKGKSEGYSSALYESAWDNQQLLAKQDLVENDFHSLKKMNEQIKLILPNQPIMEYLSTFEIKDFDERFLRWRKQIQGDLQFQQSLLNIAEKEENAQGYNYVNWCIQFGFEMDKSYSSYSSSISKSLTVLNIFNVHSIEQGFTHILVSELNNKVKLLIKYLSESVRVGPVSQNLFTISDFSAIECKLESKLRFKFEGNKTTCKFDWNYIRNQFISKQLCLEILSVILTKKVQYQQPEIEKKLLILKSSKIVKVIESMLYSILLTYQEQIELISNTDLSKNLKMYSHNNQISSYDELIELYQNKSNFSTSSDAKYLTKKVVRDSLSTLTILSSQIQYTLANYNKKSESLCIVSILASLLNVKEKNQGVLEGEIMKNLISEFNVRSLFPELINQQKSSLIDCMLSQASSLMLSPRVIVKEEHDLRCLHFLKQLLLVLTPNCPISETNHLFAQAKYRKAKLVANELIATQTVNLETAFANLGVSQDFSKLRAILIKSQQSPGSDFKFLKLLRDIFIGFQMHAYIALQLTNKSRYFQEAKTKMNDCLKQVLKFDLEKESQQIDESIGDLIQYSCPLGYLLNQQNYKNDMKVLARALSEVQEPNLKDINISKIMYVESENQIKALKVFYQIEDQEIETQWHGQPDNQKQLAMQFTPYIETLTFGEDHLVGIEIQRGSNVGIKFETSGGKKYQIGQKVDEESEGKEVKKGGKILWLEVGFMPVDTNYPDYEDQVLYHLAYYWIETD